ncbi:MAG: nickel-dependent lactate racemase, partial [Chloroflexota bacterium]|nr:nickel-dependent lactate racemase [Chloroflexota bacterium]
MRITFEIPETILHQLLDPVPMPLMARVRYDEPTPTSIEDVEDAVRRQFNRREIRDTIRPGQRIAIAAGSRGIGKLPEIVRSLVQVLRERGARPFIFPAMGSHGGATAEGQRAVLAHLGVTEESVGAPIESSMAVEVIGHTAGGEPVQLDSLAARADGIVMVARVKPHTAFRGPYESGLAKMIAIGLGKQAGAATTHARGFGEMARQVPERARVSLSKAPIRFGLATLENAHD